MLVGDDPASAVYVRNKIQACHDCGIRSFADRLPADTTEPALLARIDAETAVAEWVAATVRRPGQAGRGLPSARSSPTR